MSLEVNGKTIEIADNGHLANYADWDEDVARALAEEEGIELTEQHFQLLNYLRDQYINNGQTQPMERAILKDMSKIVGKKLSSKDTYKLFPLAPSKQGNKIAGLPQVIRKGGY